MTARDYCNLCDWLPDRKFPWPRRHAGFAFTKFDRFGRSVESRFLPKEQCVTVFDLFRFVAKYNMEDWIIGGADEPPYVGIATTEVEAVNHGRVICRFTMVQN